MLRKITTHRVALSIAAGCFLLAAAGGPSGSRSVAHQAGRSAQKTAEIFRAGVSAFAAAHYQTADSCFQAVLGLDSLYQDDSGRSAWYYLGLVRERRADEDAARRILAQGHNRLAAARKSDFYLSYELARLLALTDSPDAAKLVTELAAEVYTQSSPAGAPELWRQIYEETSFLFSGENKVQYDRASQDAGGMPGQLLLEFFKKNDSYPSTPEIEALQVYFQRLHEAHKLFGTTETARGFDDRGVIYVRFGEPWRLHSDHSGIMGDIGWAVYPYEMWFYNPIQNDLYYTFMRGDTKTYYRLVEGPESVFGSFYRGRSNLLNRRDARREAARQAGSIELGRNRELTQSEEGETAMRLRIDMYRAIAPSHADFRRRLYQISNSPNYVEALDYAIQHFPPQDKDHAAYVDTTAPPAVFFRMDQFKTLPAFLSFARFRAPEDSMRLEVYYSVFNKDLVFRQEKSGYRADIKGEVSVLSQAYDLASSAEIRGESFQLEEGATEFGTYVGQQTLSLPYRDFNLFLRLINPAGNRLAVIREALPADSFAIQGFGLSDIQLASKITPSRGVNEFVKNGLEILPLPERQIAAEAPLFIYYEIYALSRDSLGHTQFTVEYQLESLKNRKGIFRKLAGVFGGGKTQSITISETHQGQRLDEVMFISFNLGELKAGDIRLVVTVTDLNTGRRVSKSTMLEIMPSQSKGG